MIGSYDLRHYCGFACGILVAAIGCSPSAPPGARVPVFTPQRVLPSHFPAIKNAPTITADEADENLGPTDLVLGVVIEGQARAYPINMLTGPTREIINDTLGGRAIAATW